MFGCTRFTGNTWMSHPLVCHWVLSGSDCSKRALSFSGLNHSGLIKKRTCSSNADSVSWANRQMEVWVGECASVCRPAASLPTMEKKALMSTYIPQCTVCCANPCLCIPHVWIFFLFLFFIAHIFNLFLFSCAHCPAILLDWFSFIVHNDEIFT